MGFRMEIIDAVFLVAIIMFSAVIHELMHGVATNKLGDPTARLMGRLTLNPIVHLDMFGSIILPIVLTLTNSPLLFGWAKPVPYNPYNLKDQRWGEAFVAVAGSATNLLLAVMFGLLVRFSPLLGLDATTISLAATIAFVNLFLGLFNLIPFPPLDGFTALRSALPWHLASTLQRFEHSVRSAGALSIIFFLIAFYYLLAGPFFNLVLFLFGLLTGGGVL